MLLLFKIATSSSTAQCSGIITHRSIAFGEENKPGIGNHLASSSFALKRRNGGESESK